MQILEILAILSGIVSVWFSKKENIWVYPTGLVNTLLYIYLSWQADLFGEAAVNVFYTLMSIYGWYNWLRKDQQSHYIVQISFSTKRVWIEQLVFFSIIYVTIFISLRYIQGAFAPGAIPWADAFASAAAFTAMWLMTRKKVESWIWWVITNIASMPLYYVKGLTFTSVYYFILLILAISGWVEWKTKAHDAARSSANN